MRLIYLFLLLLPFPLAAQSVHGRIQDYQTNANLPSVSVRIVPTDRSTLTDTEGRFQLDNLEEGAYSLVLSSVGYEPLTLPVRVLPGQPLNLVIRLRPAIVQLNQQIVVTAQRRGTADFQQPEATTVLTARDLRERAPRTTPEALLGATGVWIQKTNHGGGSPFIRGLTGQQTLLLVDGIRLNNATFRSGPNQYLNTIDPQSLERLEVVRSTGSVAYGSDAIGGVVNVLTRTPQFSETARFTGSLFGKAMTGGMEYGGRVEAGYQSAWLAVTGGLAYHDFGDLRAGRGLGVLRPTGYRQWSGDVKARLRFGDRYVATFAWQDLEQDRVPVYHKVKLENFQYNQFDPQRRQLAYARLEGFYGYRWLRSVQATLSWQQQTEGRQSQKNGNPVAVLERDQTRSRGLTLLAYSEPARFWQIQTGLEGYADRVSSRRTDQNQSTSAEVSKRGLYPDGATMQSLAAFSLHTITLRRLTLTAGGRYNAFQIQVPEPTPGGATLHPSALVGNAGLSYALFPWLRVVASRQSAFRAPNIDDLGTLGIVDFRYETPNTALRPERSVNTEAGLKMRTDGFSATLMGYHNQLTDFINRVRAGKDSLQGYPVYRKENSAKAFIRGLEADVEWQVVRNWLFYGSLIYTYGQNVSAGEPFRRIPPLNGRAGLTYRRPVSASGADWWLRAEALVAGAQTRLAKGDRDDNRIGPAGTPAWQIFSLNGGYRWQNLTLSAELHNLFDEAYRTHGSGVDGMGRSAWLAVKWEI